MRISEEKFQKMLQKRKEAQQRYREKQIEKQKEKKEEQIKKFQERKFEKIKSGEWKMKKFSSKRMQYFEKDKAFYLKIWNTRPHYCCNCGAYLGDEFYNPINPEQPINLYRYAHILPKVKYKEIRHLNENLVLLCYFCHSKLDNGQNPEELSIYKKLHKNGYIDRLEKMNEYFKDNNIEKYE